MVAKTPDCRSTAPLTVLDRKPEDRSIAPFMKKKSPALRLRLRLRLRSRRSTLPGARGVRPLGSGRFLEASQGLRGLPKAASRCLWHGKPVQGGSPCAARWYARQVVLWGALSGACAKASWSMHCGFLGDALLEPVLEPSFACFCFLPAIGACTFNFRGGTGSLPGLELHLNRSWNSQNL